MHRARFIISLPMLLLLASFFSFGLYASAVYTSYYYFPMESSYSISRNIALISSYIFFAILGLYLRKYERKSILLTVSLLTVFFFCTNYGLKDTLLGYFSWILQRMLLVMAEPLPEEITKIPASYYLLFLYVLFGKGSAENSSFHRPKGGIFDHKEKEHDIRIDS